MSEYFVVTIEGRRRGSDWWIPVGVAFVALPSWEQTPEKSKESKTPKESVTK